MDLFGYIKGNRKGNDARRMELEAMRDPLLGDALEGLESVPGDHEEAIRRLRVRISDRTSKRPVYVRSKYRALSAVAASVLLILSIGGSYLLFRALDDTGYNLTAHLDENDLYLEIDGVHVLSKKTEYMRSGMVCDYKPDIFADQSIPNIVLSPVVVTPSSNELLAINNLRERIADAELQSIQYADIAQSWEMSDSNSPVAALAMPEIIPDENANKAKVIAYKEKSKHLDAAGTVNNEAVVKECTSSRRSTSLDMASAGTVVEKKTISSTDEFYKYVSKNKKLLTDSDGKEIKGETEAEFKVDSEGRPYDVKIIKSIGAAADVELKRLLNSGPLWSPALGKVTIKVVL